MSQWFKNLKVPEDLQASVIGVTSVKSVNLCEKVCDNSELETRTAIQGTTNSGVNGVNAKETPLTQGQNGGVTDIINNISAFDNSITQLHLLHQPDSQAIKLHQMEREYFHLLQQHDALLWLDEDSIPAGIKNASALTVCNLLERMRDLYSALHEHGRYVPVKLPHDNEFDREYWKTQCFDSQREAEELFRPHGGYREARQNHNEIAKAENNIELAYFAQPPASKGVSKAIHYFKYAVKAVLAQMESEFQKNIKNDKEAIMKDDIETKNVETEEEEMEFEDYVDSDAAFKYLEELQIEEELQRMGFWKEDTES